MDFGIICIMLRLLYVCTGTTGNNICFKVVNTEEDKTLCETRGRHSLAFQNQADQHNK